MTEQTAKEVPLEMRKNDASTSQKMSRSKCDKANSGKKYQGRVVQSVIKPSVGIMSVLPLFGEVLCLYCLSFNFEFEQSQTTQNKSSKKTFNPELAVNRLYNNPARVIINKLRL